jgi:predicted DNA-binding transcriptional regulator AlpA
MEESVTTSQKVPTLSDGSYTVPLWPTAGEAIGISRTTAYKLARAGEFPVRVLRLGTSYRVVTAELRELLEVPAADAVA